MIGHKKEKNMKFTKVSKADLLLVIAIGLYGSFFSSLATAQERQYGNYKIILNKDPEVASLLNKITVMNNKKILIEETGIVSINNGHDLQEINDLDDIKSSLIVINSYSGGAHCCYQTTIVDLGRTFKIIANVEGKNSPVELLKNSNSELFKIEIIDWSYTYLWTSFSKSPAPKVTLIYSDGKYVPDIKAMQKAELSTEALASEITKINSKKYMNFKYAYGQQLDYLDEQRRRSNDEYLGNLLSLVLDLIYSGNYEQATEIINKTWPSDKNSRLLLINDLKASITKSPYGRSIEKMNNFNKYKN